MYIEDEGKQKILEDSNKSKDFLMLIQNLRCLFWKENVSSIYFEQNERFDNNKCFGTFVSKCKELVKQGGEMKIDI